ncbi:MAG TPA: acyl-CoA dehydrogenase family protein [Spirochaetota bacterium]|nr:acyl-CoA dehydrogenase family protein [Spirochaetota bacterium]HPI89567.1 acyl-CoA dehydrogenase family protein [Spirochaetota bacterium]HPR49031.1 acyl-CoA dehydrogenase family protein [Spirochaetota bacterium]
MSLPDRNNPYSFDDYLAWRKDVDYYADDPFIQQVVKHFTGKVSAEVDAEARAISKKASFRWRDMAESIAWPEKRPYMMHYDGHKNRIDRIVRPRETEIMESEIFGEKLFADDKSPWVKLIKMFIVYQNGEACVACPITCTEGLVVLLNKFADTPETKEILKHCKEGINGHVAIGGQYLSEIQGGSDVPANVLEAVKEGDTWKLYGAKFFCSATHADYVAITAKPSGSEKVALFVMPSWMPGNKEKEIRNGYTIDRIKWKMGTSELTTGELTFNGAVAYPVGPLDRGVANVVGIVLTYSRLTVGLSAAAFMTRAAREARRYSEFRQAFGVSIGNFPLVKVQLNDVEKYARRTTAGAFKLYRDFLELEGGTKGGLDTDEPLEMKKKRFAVRELIMLQKITASLDCTDVIRKAMSIFGGHGVMEDFSSLPRLYRDSAINELWEGPRNVLLTQMHRDIQRVRDWYSPSEFVADILAGGDPETIDSFSRELAAITAHVNLFGADEETLRICAQWDDFTTRFFHAYQDLALAEIK